MPEAYDDDEYADILKRSWDDIPKPQLLPNGSWRLKVKNAKYMEPKAADQNPFVLVVYSPMEPLADVDEDAVGELDGYDVSQNRVFNRIWLETAADWDGLRNHIRKHGIDTGGRSPEDTLKALKGTEIIAFLDRETFTNGAGEVREQNVASKFAPVDD